MVVELRLGRTEVRVWIWKTVCVVELSLVVSVLLGRMPVTESPSARLVASSVEMLLEVLVVEESGEGGVVDAAAVGLGDIEEEDGAAEDGGVESVGIVDVASRREDVVREGISVKMPEGTTADGEVCAGG